MDTMDYIKATLEVLMVGTNRTVVDLTEPMEEMVTEVGHIMGADCRSWRCHQVGV